MARPYELSPSDAGSSANQPLRNRTSGRQSHSLKQTDFSARARSAAAPARAPRRLPDPRAEAVLAATAGERSPAHAGARGSRALSSAPICPTARPAEAADRASQTGTTKPRTTSGVRGGRRYRATSQTTSQTANRVSEPHAVASTPDDGVVVRAFVNVLGRQACSSKRVAEAIALADARGVREGSQPLRAEVPI
jgi:hypothetical protein